MAERALLLGDRGGHSSKSRTHPVIALAQSNGCGEEAGCCQLEGCSFHNAVVTVSGSVGEGVACRRHQCSHWRKIGLSPKMPTPRYISVTHGRTFEHIHFHTTKTRKTVKTPRTPSHSASRGHTPTEILCAVRGNACTGNIERALNNPPLDLLFTIAAAAPC
jgi:hypothetical protein